MPRDRERKHRIQKVRLVHPLIPGLIIGYIGWMLRGYFDQGLLQMLAGDDFKLIGIFGVSVLIGYWMTRQGHFYMRKAGTARLRQVWTGVMIVGLLLLIASLTIQLALPAYGPSSMYAWALISIPLLISEGKGLWIEKIGKQLVDGFEGLMGVDLDGLDKGPLLEEFEDDDPEPPTDDDSDEDEGEPFPPAAPVRQDVLSQFTVGHDERPATIGRDRYRSAPSGRSRGVRH